MELCYRMSRFMASVITWTSVVMMLFFIVIAIVPRIVGLTPYIVMSGSMEPVISTGSVAYVDKSDTEHETGDIIAYEVGNGQAVVHRIIGYGDTGYVVKGDANDTQDMQEVRPNQLLGSYVGDIPYVGYFMVEFVNHTISFGIVTLPAAVVVMIGLIIVLHFLHYLSGKSLDMMYIRLHNTDDN